LAARLGVGDLEKLSAQHPMLDEIFLDGYDEATGTLSAVAVHRILDYVGRAVGYRFNYQGTRRPSSKQENTMTQETKDITGEDFAKGMREFNERIALAQAEGNNKLANEIYRNQQAWIGKVKGTGPIVNGRRTA
jgi:hypothetical protein